MTITAKFASVCPCCGARIVPGTKVEWSKGSPAKHAKCPSAATPVDAPSGEPAIVVVDGNTYPVREQLRALGCRWDASSQVWMAQPSKAAQARALVAAAPKGRPTRRRSGRGHWNGCSCGARELPGGGLSANACESCRFDEYDC